MAGGSGDPNALLRASWERNAPLWTAAVRDGAIASRREATDPALLSVLSRLEPASVLDLGCGEGWLAAWLVERGAQVVGIDGSGALIETARQQVPAGRFDVLDYDDLVATPAKVGGPFAAIVANFSLLDDRVDALLRAAAGLLSGNGRVVVQTVHPLAVAEPYSDGWRQEDFAAFLGDGWTGMPWYFRTLARWVADFAAAGLVVDRLTEPRLPGRNAPASLLFELRHA